MEVDLIGNEDQHVNDEGFAKPQRIPELIMDKIFHYLSYQDLKNCRFINKGWNETVISSSQFQSKSKNLAVFNHDDEHRYKTSYTVRVRDINRLGDCLLRSPLKIRNFPLHTFIVGTSGSSMGSSTLINFLNAISPVAQKIVMEHHCELVPLGKNEVAYWRVFPQLKYLKLELQYDLKLVTTMWKFLGHLMERGNAPRLEKLHIRRHDTSTSLKTTIPTELSSSISKLISTINVPATKRKLKSLKIKSPLDLRHLREFHALELNLTEFHLEVKNISDIKAASIVRSILNKQSKTLSRLKIIDWNKPVQRVPTKVDIFPTLPNLETLIIDTEKFVFENIVLKEKFPRLKSLIFRGTSSPRDDFCGNEIEPALSIKEIGITRRLGDENQSEVILHKAVQYFPNIRKLQIPAVSNMTNVVFNTMPQLEELILDTTNILCIDDIIVGMTLKECEDALGKMINQRRNIPILAKTRHARPISQLTRLRTLRLFSESDYGETSVGVKVSKKKVEITKLSIVMVLLKMESLRCIDFGKRYFPLDYQFKLQPNLWKKVFERFNILYTAREYASKVSS